ncbi:MAG TPA: ABC transporter substrate-binding protein [Beijerinckiaceae bacterium]|nr:ABC transporter substrate-binding protein [Beijerinckiaceae bacterium]
MKLTRRMFSAAALALGLSASGQALAQAQTEVRFYFPVAVGGPVTKIIDDYAAEFMKENPGIKVTPIYSGDYVQTVAKALTAIKGGDIPETAILLAADLFLLLGEDVIVPVSDVAASADDKKWLDGFFPAFMENSKYKGKIYSVPFQRSTPVLYWNKDAFKAAGLDPEKGPSNWAEMREMAKKLTKKDASGAVSQWGIQIPSDGNSSWLFSGMTTGNGVRMFNADGNQVSFDDPRVIEAVNNWYALSNEDGSQPKGLISWGATPRDFIEGKAAMMWTTTGNLTNVRNNAKFPFGVAFLPGMKQAGAPTGGGNFYMFKGISKAKQEATLKFMKFMTTPERAADWSVKTGYVAVSPAAYETKTLKDYTASFPPAAVARDQLKHAIPELSVYENQRVMKILNDAVQAVMTGAKPADVALKAAQQDAMRVLKDFK